MVERKENVSDLEYDELLKELSILCTINFSSKERKKHNEYRKEFLEFLDKLNYSDESTVSCLKSKFIEIYNQL